MVELRFRRVPIQNLELPAGALCTFVRYAPAGVLIEKETDMNHNHMLEFDIILDKLAQYALSEPAAARCRALAPSLNEAEVRLRMEETTQAKQLILQFGAPPLPGMAELSKVLDLVAADAMLTPEQVTQVSLFLASCRRMKAYLKKAQALCTSGVAWYGGSIQELPQLEDEIGRCIRNGAVDDKASPRLDDLRRALVLTSDQIKAKLDALLRKNKDWFSESFVAVRYGRCTLPVKREHKNDLPGTVVEQSNTGGTLFIEPASVGRLQAQLHTLQVEEDGEVRRILYTLTALIGDCLPALKLDMEAMETLDFLFAKAKLSIGMDASPVEISAGRTLRMVGARHPLLEPGTAVPLDLEMGKDTRGVVITGPNTGGKTVALKTVGLLSLMAQSGLHIPAGEDSTVCMNDLVLCDIGDGQSIAENLSTFSAHMKNIVAVLEKAGRESLVLLDELGSGTDPAEGMGLAVAVLDELCARGCLFVVTTHYPEIKAYAAQRPGLTNARMAFDKNSLRPLYRLELGAAGESCALYIAEKMGMPQSLLKRAYEAAYGSGTPQSAKPADAPSAPAAPGPGIIRQKQAPEKPSRSESFQIGDSVVVYPNKEIGIVFARDNGRGEIGVQVRGEKRLVNHKRMKLQVSARELYPENYDFSILFDSVENRKARHILERKHVEGTVVTHREASGTGAPGNEEEG